MEVYDSGKEATGAFILEFIHAQKVSIHYLHQLNLLQFWEQDATAVFL